SPEGRRDIREDSQERRARVRPRSWRTGSPPLVTEKEASRPCCPQARRAKRGNATRTRPPGTVGRSAAQCQEPAGGRPQGGPHQRPEATRGGGEEGRSNARFPPRRVKLTGARSPLAR